MSTHVVAVWAIAVLAAAALSLCCTVYFFSRRPQHAGGGEGALTVRYLIARVEAETSRGRHRLRVPVDDHETAEIPRPSLPPEAPNPAVLRRILAGLRRL
ncbi:hypothetical protein [Saccharopolyspora sp. NPDC002686]|uniref:hypothetical protein n=1 Tax=Saccharopolyspora sp. NPDC002686 TaxID=3154541 RepID=UPI003331C948